MELQELKRRMNHAFMSPDAFDVRTKKGKYFWEWDEIRPGVNTATLLEVGGLKKKQIQSGIRQGLAIEKTIFGPQNLKHVIVVSLTLKRPQVGFKGVIEWLLIKLRIKNLYTKSRGKRFVEER